MYNMLYVKSNYSLLSSLLTIDDIIDYNIKNNRTNAIICDDNMYGTMEFIKKCNLKEIKPVVGLEVSFDNYKILLYIKNYQGYLNLIKICTRVNDNTLTIEDIINYKDNLFLLVPFDSLNFYLEHKDKFTDIYLGFSNKKEESEALVITKDIVYLKPCLYKRKEDSDYLKYLYLIRDGKTLNDNISYDTLNKELEVTDIINTYENIGLLNTLKIVDECILEFPKPSLLLPIYECPKGVDSSIYLMSLAKAGLSKRLNNNVTKDYLDRLSYELNIINNMGFANYFLVVYDFIRYAKKKGILVGPGRGSAAGSLVAYSLGITEIDPLKYNLLFERFLNPERKTMPDIDTDIPDIYRDDIINYVTDKYGKKRVSGIVTFGTLAAKQVLRDVSRIFSVPLYKVDKLTSFIPVMSHKKLEEFYRENEKFRAYINSDEVLSKVYKIASIIEGFPRQIGTHAAGIVMCKKDLDEVIPLTKSDDMYLTGYSMNYLEELGLLKMDFLGIRNLTIIMNVMDMVYKTRGERIEFNDIPLDDRDTYNLFARSDTSGIFQFESNGMRGFLRKLKPSSFDDLIAAIALFRPGPAENIDLYIARKEGREKVIYQDKSLEPILKETYGIMIYQEQIMQVANIYAGYTLGEADILRRAISKKKVDVLKNEESKFISKAKALGHDESISKTIFASILKFAGYGFNKSHAVAYSLVAYKMAYLKVHYKLEFYANLLNNVIGATGKMQEYLREIRSHDLKVLKPDINKSTNRFAIDGTVNHLWVHEGEDGFGSFKFGGKYRLSTAGLITDVYASYETDIDEDVLGDLSSIEAGLKFGKMTNKWTLAGKLAYNNIDVDIDDTNNFIIGAEGLYNFDDRISGQLGIDYTLVDKFSFNTADEDSIALTAQVNYLRGGLWSLYYTTELKADDVDDQIGFKYGIQF